MYNPFDYPNYNQYYQQPTHHSYDVRNQYYHQHTYEPYDMRSPYTPQEPKNVPAHYQKYMHLKRPTLNLVRPWVRYGMNEAKYTSMEHAMTEVAAITYLIGKGYNQKDAHYIVESWEKNEQF
jgi:hypothetical protein